MAYRRNRRNSPMPLRGAIYLSRKNRGKGKSKGTRKRRAAGSRRARAASPYAKILARLNRAGRRKNGIALRTNRKRRNGIALRTNRGHFKRRNSGRRRVFKRRSAGRRRSFKHAFRKRRNGIALRTNRGYAFRKRSNKKGRRNGRYARRNGLALRTNRVRRNRRNSGSAGGLFGKLLRPVQKVVGMVPVIGKPLAKILPPVALGALGLAGVHLTFRYLLPMLPASASMVVERVAPVGYTLGGALLGALVQVVPSKFLSSGTKKALAGAMVVGGAAVDTFRYVQGSSASLGDGGLWQLGGYTPLSGYTPLGDADAAAVYNGYGDALPTDACQAPMDLDPDEGGSAVRGPRFWRQRFPFARRVTHVAGGVSPHAGVQGHRWGWLIKMIGWDNFQALAQLPASQRQGYLKQLRGYALSALPAPSQQPLAGYTPLAGLMYAGS